MAWAERTSYPARRAIDGLASFSGTAERANHASDPSRWALENDARELLPPRDLAVLLLNEGARRWPVIHTTPVSR